jgi:hypothetical protein
VIESLDLINLVLNRHRPAGIAPLFCTRATVFARAALFMSACHHRSLGDVRIQIRPAEAVIAIIKLGVRQFGFLPFAEFEDATPWKT